MSGLCVEVVGKVTIKPSSPTPSHLQTLKLSLLDQHETPCFIPLLLFFPASATPNAVRVDRLKKSLSETLTLFYPFAGRIVDNRYIHCNDNGISLFETRVNTQMTRVLEHPTPDELVQLIPEDDTIQLLRVQINIFDCGGMVLSVTLSHQIGDASSFGFFLNTWAAISRGDATVAPIFAASDYFPPIETELPPPVSTLLGTLPELVTKRLVFNAANISTICDNCFQTLSYWPTRVEAVSAFIWWCTMKADGWRSSTLLQGMNIRTRMNPPLASSFIGNFTSTALVTSNMTNSTLPQELGCLVDQLHKAIRKVDGDYVRKLQEENRFLEAFDLFYNQSQDSSNFFTITSWCGFPLYEADFGWGRPEWVATVQLVCPDLIILIDTKCGTGIEAWVTMKNEVMGRFECEPDLIAFTSCP